MGVVELPESSMRSKQQETALVAAKSPIKRAILALLGIFFVFVAAIGVFLPGIPTVGPLLLASVLLTKSSPRLEAKLVRNKFFARYLAYVDGTNELSFRAKLTSILLMWTSILVSCVLLNFAEFKPWLLAILVIAGIVGTVFIIRFGKRNSESDSNQDS